MRKTKKNNKVEDPFKECEICKLSIDINEEHYLHLEEFKLKKQIGRDMFFHNTCFREKFLMRDKMMKMMNDPTSFAKKLMEGMHG